MNGYSLVVQNVKTYKEFEKLSDSLEKFDLIKYVFDAGTYFKKENEAMFCSWEEQKWEGYNGQMIIISEMFPQMIFELTVRCAEIFWRVYYQDGKTEICMGGVVYERPRETLWQNCF